MDPFDIGDPYIEWNEELAAREILTEENEEVFNATELKSEVQKILMTEYDFTIEDAEEEVNLAARNKPDMWNENADAKDLANYLASDDGDSVL